MLKGKKGVYILIPLNILIWGFFIYRFVSLYNEDETSVDSASCMVLKMEPELDSISYKLNLKYSDPFLRNQPKPSGGNASSPKANTKKQLIVESSSKSKENEKPFADIKYLGLVKNNTNGTVTAIISINGSSKLIKQDEIIDGMCFKNFTTENLTVFTNKEKRIISK